MLISIPPLLHMEKYAGWSVRPPKRRWKLWLIPAPFLLLLASDISFQLARGAWLAVQPGARALGIPATVGSVSDFLTYLGIAAFFLSPFLITSFSWNGVRYALCYWVIQFVWFGAAALGLYLCVS